MLNMEEIDVGVGARLRYCKKDIHNALGVTDLAAIEKLRFEIKMKQVWAAFCAAKNIKKLNELRRLEYPQSFVVDLSDEASAKHLPEIVVKFRRLQSEMTCDYMFQIELLPVPRG